MRTIEKIKVWKNDSKTEIRIYVTFSEGEQGCYYFTGNKWNEKKSFTGMTEEEKKEAFLLSSKESESGKAWVNVDFTKSKKCYHTDEEDLDRASQKVFKSTTNTDFSYEG